MDEKNKQIFMLKLYFETLEKVKIKSNYRIEERLAYKCNRRGKWAGPLTVETWISKSIEQGSMF